MQFIKRRLKRETPRGIVLCIDMAIVLATYVLSNFILNSFYGRFSVDVMVFKIPFVLLAYLLSFLAIKPYRGFVRQTGLKDGQNVLGAVLLAGFILSVTSFLQRIGFSPIQAEKYLRFSYSIVVLHLLLTAVSMIVARVFYSEFYKVYVLGGRNLRRILIYGAGDSGIITINALQADTRINNQVLGFVDDNPKKAGQKINGFRVYHSSKITMDFVVKNRIDDIVISIQNISRDRLNAISTVLEELPVKIKIIPPPTDWLDGKYTGKQIKSLRIEDLLGRKAIELNNAVLDSELEGKVFLVTGAAGSIGSEIARQLATKNFKLLVLLDQAESALYDLQQSIKTANPQAIHYIVGNVRDAKSMTKLFETFKPQWVYHAAAYKHVPLMEANPYEAVTTNVMGTKIIADLAVKYKVNKFVLVSTDKAVNPTNVMGATKRVAEIYVGCLKQKSETNFIVTRFGNVLGSNGSVIPLFRRQIENGGPVTLTHTEITRYFMTIPEACSLVLEASVMGKGGEIFVFDMGESIKIFDLAKRMIRLSGFSYPDEINIAVTGLRPGEKIYEELLASDENTLKTYHDKIMIAHVRSGDETWLCQQIAQMCTYVLETEFEQDGLQLVKQLKLIVPEFKSQNSSYAALDLPQGHPILKS